MQMPDGRVSLFLLFHPIKSCRDKRIRRSDLKMAKWKVDELEFKDRLILARLNEMRCICEAANVVAAVRRSCRSR